MNYKFNDIKFDDVNPLSNKKEEKVHHDWPSADDSFRKRLDIIMAGRDVGKTYASKYLLNSLYGKYGKVVDDNGAALYNIEED